MVILQFNKLIRNKWVWGVFAVAVSAAFCFDDIFTSAGRSEGPANSIGTLAGESVDAKLFRAIQEDVRGFGRNRDVRIKEHEVNRLAWENYAALQVADRIGLEATVGQVQSTIRSEQAFQVNGAFDYRTYESLLRANSLLPEIFESSLRRKLTLAHLGQNVLADATWVSPMELDQAIDDMTDVFTVKVASFTQTKAEADAVKVTDADIRKWYDAHVKSLELPERVKIRFVRFDATDAKVLAKMAVTDDDLHDLYDSSLDRFTSTDTNGVETVKKFEEVKGTLEKELRQVAAVEFFRTNLTARVYSGKAVKGKSRLDDIAAADGLKVQVSDWFSVEGAQKEGFMKSASSILPGASDFADKVSELDPETEDLRYNVVASDRTVWLIEKASTSPKHVPSFDEAKAAIRPQVVRDAKADAFKASVEAIAKLGSKALRARKGVSTNLTFTVRSVTPEMGIENAYSVARAAMHLKKGEVSEFTLTGTGKAILVLCEDRQPGDAAEKMIIGSQLREELSMLARRQVPDAWKKWNLARLGFAPDEEASIEEVKEAVE